MTSTTVFLVIVVSVVHVAKCSSLVEEVDSFSLSSNFDRNYPLLNMELAERRELCQTKLSEIVRHLGTLTLPRSSDYFVPAAQMYKFDSFGEPLPALRCPCFPSLYIFEDEDGSQEDKYSVKMLNPYSGCEFEFETAIDVDEAELSDEKDEKDKKEKKQKKPKDDEDEEEEKLSKKKEKKEDEKGKKGKKEAKEEKEDVEEEGVEKVKKGKKEAKEENEEEKEKEKKGEKKTKEEEKNEDEEEKKDKKGETEAKEEEEKEKGKKSKKKDDGEKNEDDEKQSKKGKKKEEDEDEEKPKEKKDKEKKKKKKKKNEQRSPLELHLFLKLVSVDAEQRWHLCNKARRLIRYEVDETTYAGNDDPKLYKFSYTAAPPETDVAFQCFASPEVYIRVSRSEKYQLFLITLVENSSLQLKTINFPLS